MIDDGECGVTRCTQPAYGSVPVGSPLPGDRSFAGGDLRLPTCVEHGREHHRLVMGRDPLPEDITIHEVVQVPHPTPHADPLHDQPGWRRLMVYRQGRCRRRSYRGRPGQQSGDLHPARARAHLSAGRPPSDRRGPASSVHVRTKVSEIGNGGAWPSITRSLLPDADDADFDAAIDEANQIVALGAERVEGTAC